MPIPPCYPDILKYRLVLLLINKFHDSLDSTLTKRFNTQPMH